MLPNPEVNLFPSSPLGDITTAVSLAQDILFTQYQDFKATKSTTPQIAPPVDAPAWIQEDYWRDVYERGTEDMCATASAFVAVALAQGSPEKFRKIFFLETQKNRQFPFHNLNGQKISWDFHRVAVMQDFNGAWYAASPANNIYSHTSSIQPQENPATRVLTASSFEELTQLITKSYGGNWPDPKELLAIPDTQLKPIKAVLDVKRISSHDYKFHYTMPFALQKRKEGFSFDDQIIFDNLILFKTAAEKLADLWHVQLPTQIQ